MVVVRDFNYCSTFLKKFIVVNKNQIYAITAFKDFPLAA